MPKMLATPLDNWIGDEDSIWSGAIAVNDHPMFDSMVVADDELTSVNAAFEGLEVEVVSKVGGDAGTMQFADDRALAGAAIVGAKAAV